MYMVYTVDDLCLSYLDNFVYFDNIKKRFPDFKLIAFAIANFKNYELLLESNIFKTWFEKNKDWVEIGVHSYDHQYPPDGDRDDEFFWIKKSLDNLRPFLPEKYGYRSPGWQTTNKTVQILGNLGFRWIAYESKIVDIQNKEIIENKVINSHLYDINSIKKVEEVIHNEVGIL